MYDRFTDEALADRVNRLADNIRFMGVDERKLLLGEVARRLTERSSHNEELQKFKERIRDRMLREADKRNWCGEFDQIIVEYGMRGRFGQYKVTYPIPAQHRTYIREGRLPVNWAVVGDNVVISMLAKTDSDAVKLANNHIARYFGTTRGFDHTSVKEVTI